MIRSRQTADDYCR